MILRCNTTQHSTISSYGVQEVRCVSKKNREVKKWGVKNYCNVHKVNKKRVHQKQEFGKNDFHSLQVGGKNLDQLGKRRQWKG